MRNDDFRKLVREYTLHRLTRRQVVTRMGEIGLSLGTIWAVLDRATTRPAGGAVARGSHGTLKLLYWQAPTILNPHLAGGSKDVTASRLVVEPLFTADATGNIAPVLAAEVPTHQNGGLAPDGRSVTFRLKQAVRWADGRPFTSDDVVFTYQFATNRQTAATTYASYEAIATVEALDALSVRVTFRGPTPFWFRGFIGGNGAILPRHALDSYVGSDARSAPFNLRPFGTGPYNAEAFRPGDLVVYSINQYYRDSNKPAFRQVQIKGGGDAPSAARAVLETGEYDFAPNMQVEWPVLEHMLAGRKGNLLTSTGGGVEAVYLNQTDPNKDIDGQRSSLKAPHPFLTDVKVRRALALATDRATIARVLYGDIGDASPNLLTTPRIYYSKQMRATFSIDRANRLLDESGWKRGPDGIRRKGEMKLQMTYVTTANTLRQKEQQIIKNGWEQIGASVILQIVDGTAFSGSAPGNNETIPHFYRDVQMYSDRGGLSPAPYMAQFYSGNPSRDIAQKENNWSGQNVCRWQNAQYNALYEEGLRELDPRKNIAIWIKANDLVVDQVAGIPLVDRRMASVKATTLDIANNMTPFDSETHNIANWRRTA
jgi:peptide/nickel transport system substrate-binding protein